MFQILATFGSQNHVSVFFGRFVLFPGNKTNNPTFGVFSPSLLSKIFTFNAFLVFIKNYNYIFSIDVSH